MKERRGILLGCAVLTAVLLLSACRPSDTAAESSDVTSAVTPMHIVDPETTEEGPGVTTEIPQTEAILTDAV